VADGKKKQGRRKTAGPERTPQAGASKILHKGFHATFGSASGVPLSQQKSRLSLIAAAR
jgi:hypothetical protein